VSEPHPFLKAFQKLGAPLAMRDPLAQLLKGEILEMDPEAGAATLAFAPDERFLQAGGLIQGGIVTAMLDYAMALAAFTRVAEGRSFASVSLTTHYLKPVLPGRRLARAKLDRLGTRMVFASGELFAEAGEAPLATATSVMAMTR